MIKRKDHDLLSEAYSQIGGSVSGAPSMLGKPVMVTMDMPGASAYDNDSEDDCESCGGHGEYDPSEIEMACNELAKIADIAPRLKDLIKGEKGLEGWVAAKITKAADYVSGVYDYIQYSGESASETNIFTSFGADDHDEPCAYGAAGCRCGNCPDCQ